jgi:hypothetical protein
MVHEYVMPPTNCLWANARSALNSNPLSWPHGAGLSQDWERGLGGESEPVRGHLTPVHKEGIHPGCLLSGSVQKKTKL